MKYIPEFNYPERDFKPFGKPPSDDMCGQCTAYYKMLYENGLKDTPDPPHCQRHILDSINKLSVEDFDGDEEALKETQILLDPVAWAHQEFEWEARFYQEWLLSCTSDSKVYRAGRRSGKCLIEGTLVATPNGPIEIEKLNIGDEVFDEHGNIIKVKDVFDQGIQDVVDLTHRNKVLATCTINHPWLTTRDDNTKQRKVRKTSELKKSVQIVRKEIQAPLGAIEDKNTYVLGALTGDGCSREKSGLVISSSDEEIVRHIANLLDCSYKKLKANNYSWYLPTSAKKKINNYDWIDKKYAHEKKANLDIIKTWNRTSLLNYVAGLIDTDGSVYSLKNEIIITIGMQAKEVIEALKYAFLALWQVDLSIHIDNRPKYVNGPIYQLLIKNIHHCKRILKELDPFLVCERKKYKREYDNLRPHNYSGDRVGVKIENPRKAQCYDIHVDSKTNLYLLANGLVTHNTASMLIEVLHALFTNANYKVLMAAHSDSAVVAFFDGLREFIYRGPNTSKSVLRDTKSPSRIDFKNGSKIIGFTLNPNQNDAANKIRGQDANFIVIDEIDFIKPKDIDVLMAIKASHPDVKVVCSSTPSGARAKFFSFCTDKNLEFKEFWFIGPENPNWTEKTERQFKNQFTEAEYQREIYAIFGESDEGVFKAAYIDSSLRNYKMETNAPVEGAYYIFGVDWNKTHGTHIVILSVGGDGLTLVKKIVVPEAEYTQTAGVTKIIELNNTWKPKYIFVDRGYGSTNVELLKQHGLRNPETGLHKNVVDIAMNQYLDIRHPITGNVEGRPAKPYLVTQTAKLLEDGKLILPREEDTDAMESHNMGLVQQMRNYKVIGISTYGLPMYSKENEHTLVAYFVACGGFIWKEGDLSKIDYLTSIRGIAFNSAGTQYEDLLMAGYSEEEAKDQLKAKTAIPSRDLGNHRANRFGLGRKNINPNSTRDSGGNYTRRMW